MKQNYTQVVLDSEREVIRKKLRWRQAMFGILPMCQECDHDCKHIMPSGGNWYIYCHKRQMAESSQGGIISRIEEDVSIFLNGLSSDSPLIARG